MPISAPPETTPVVVACCRTAIGLAHPERGVFRHLRGEELAASVIGAVVARSGVDPATIEDVVFGDAYPRGDQAGNLARCAALMAGLPFTAAGTTVNRLGGSSLQAIAQACHAIAAGAENVQVVGGVECGQQPQPDSGDGVHPRVLVRSSRGTLSTGLTAEHLAAVHGISRDAQEAYALESRRKAALAAAAGLFAAEIVPVFGHDEDGAVVEVVADQAIHALGASQDIAELEPAFLPRSGTITSATSAASAVGAAALIVMSEAEARRQGLQPLVRVVGTAVVGVPPASTAAAPALALTKLLDRSGLRPDDVALFEIDEVFAAEAIHCVETLGLDPARVNVRGGALAIGHPPGAAGARIATTLVHALHATGGRRGVAATCVGLGQGIAIACERPG